jgi:hypothetical protein
VIDRIQWQLADVRGMVEGLNPLTAPRGNRGTRKRRVYADVISAFDIETSTISVFGEDHAICYHWQWAFGPHCVVVGRTLDQWFEFARALTQELVSRGLWLVVYVHNLSFEFQFMSGLYQFVEDEVFAVKSRRVLKCDMLESIEFRCSYLHSNMSLREYTYKMGAEHSKLSGDDFDYRAVRYPWTTLSDEQMEYCINDVIGLVEALQIEMETDGDTLYTIPITSTGYVRRDCKDAMRGYNHMQLMDIMPTWRVYNLCREAFRGGNVHASRYYSRGTLEDVGSADRSSSYPDVICNCMFPMTRFMAEPKPSLARLRELMDVRKRAVLIVARFRNLRLRDEFWGAPYLTKDKCRDIENAQIDNGRVLSADMLETTCTDVDWRIIENEYEWDHVTIKTLFSARYAHLPQPIIDLNCDYYRRKTELKGVDGQEVYYMKSKNKLNSIYGMMAQNPVTTGWVYRSGEFVIPDDYDPRAELDKHNKKAFLAYQWGVWVTAWARYRLEEGIRLAGDGFVYCDTDSVKYVGKVSFAAYNRLRRADSKASGAYAIDKSGKTHYMGEYENEGIYEKFRTLGCKRYAYVKKGKLEITVAGVPKKDGAKYLQQRGGLDAFDEGFIFTRDGDLNAGGTETHYNDLNDYGWIDVDGGRLHITKNVVIRDGTYEIGLAGDYSRLLDALLHTGKHFEKLMKIVDRKSRIWYNNEVGGNRRYYDGG